MIRDDDCGLVHSGDGNDDVTDDGCGGGDSVE